MAASYKERTNFEGIQRFSTSLFQLPVLKNASVTDRTKTIGLRGFLQGGDLFQGCGDLNPRFGNRGLNSMVNLGASSLVSLKNYSAT